MKAYGFDVRAPTGHRSESKEVCIIADGMLTGNLKSSRDSSIQIKWLTRVKAQPVNQPVYILRSNASGLIGKSVSLELQSNPGWISIFHIIAVSRFE